jgi:hypothetical protein
MEYEEHEDCAQCNKKLNLLRCSICSHCRLHFCEDHITFKPNFADIEDAEECADHAQRLKSVKKAYCLFCHTNVTGSRLWYNSHKDDPAAFDYLRVHELI